ncbi:DUF4190 domain-containing protein [Fontivita pretiosa]|jgi:hypothetical protein|uniref:DUF4190 domain-containing protein n=1 Tax=Fontivita pretiosa TaxID=2989684 RepID=UPI003D180ECE
MPLFGRETEEYERRAAAYGLWLRQRNPLAIVSAVLGIFSLIEMGVLIVFGVAGVICGAVALKQLNEPNPKYPRGQALAWVGILSSLASLIIAAVVYLLPVVEASQ